MTLDLLFAALGLWLAYAGWRSGFSGQLLRAAGALAVFLFTAPVSSALRDLWFEDQQIVSSPGIEVASMALAAVLIYVVISFGGGLLAGVIRRASQTLSAADRLGGLALGAIKASLLVYVLAVCAAFLYGPLKRLDPGDALHMRDGQVTAFVTDHDLLAPWRFPRVAELQSALRVADRAGQDERARRALGAHVSAAELVRGEAFEELLEREELVEAARQDRFALVLADEAARAYLNTPELAEALSKVDWTRVEEDLGLAIERGEAARKDGVSP